MHQLSDNDFNFNFIPWNGFKYLKQGYSILGAKRKVDIVYNIIPGRPKYF